MFCETVRAWSRQRPQTNPAGWRFTAVRTSADSAGTTPKIEPEIASYPLPNPRCFPCLALSYDLSVGAPTPTANTCHRSLREDPVFHHLSDGPCLAFFKSDGHDEKERPRGIQATPKTMVVTGASQGIGAGVTKAFIEHGYNVVANSRHITKSAVEPTKRLAVVEGNIGEASTAAEIAATAMSKFGSIDGVVNNAGIFFTKPFTDYTADEFERLSLRGSSIRRCMHRFRKNP
jgi:3-oxoacyl-ACP reductase-like protein